MNSKIFSKLKLQKKYIKRVLYRVNIYKSKFVKSFSNRLFSELLLNLEYTLKVNNVVFNMIDKKRVWIYIFQVEAIRSAQSGKVGILS